MKLFASLRKRAGPWAISLLGCLLASTASQTHAGEARQFQLGVAKIDVTPPEAIRLTGYGGRRTPSAGVEQMLWAKALAIGSDREGPALLMTLDNCGIAEETYREVVRRLKKAGVKQDRLAICLSHTHTGPCTTYWAPNIFAQDIPPEQRATIDRYTGALIDKLEQVAVAALKDRRPGILSWSQGSVGFARNRRVVVGKAAQFGDNAAGPADHALPVLKVEGTDGTLRALVANYACHCTTLGGEFNQICGDWAGYAQEYLERDHAGAIALVTIGCGADANPHPRGGADGGLALAKKHGEEIAAEVKRLLTQNFSPLSSRLTTRLKEIELPFAPHFTREQWEARAKESGIVGYHAKKNLARLDRGEKLPAQLYYPVATWNFGDDLALVFLPGEVVVDYALRLKKEFDASRLWVTAYANYVPCYIPSRRILSEGGYEAEGSLWYYDRPARISTNAEELIIKTIHGLLPKSFLFDTRKAQFPPPKTPPQALASFRTKADFVVELVASEPLIESPVAIDWSADGRLWVCEMFDYPTGVDGQYKPGGRIKVLQSTKGDGRYDKATLFLDGLPFPTGVLPWRKGALICAAPNILYAEDTDGDGKADLVRTNFTGFATHNYQARVNGFTWGLDGWLHGSSGLFGGKISSLVTGQEVDLSGRDFRLKPDTGEIEPVAGLSQMGRVRDDFDHWFGNDNGTLLWHYPLPDHYLRRNPHVTYPDPRVNVARQADANKLFPVSRTLERFNDPQMANRLTSACGLEIYRDDLLGTNHYGNAFICEPVHNLVTRRLLERDGVTFTARRADDEQRSEFLASTDNWFRPVQVRTGPDGALWIVDMYRFVVEHPRWIPSNRLAQLDVRAGADKGRIYRIYPRQAKLRPVRDLTRLAPLPLAVALQTPNGPTRDLVHRQILDSGLSISSVPTGKIEWQQLTKTRRTTPRKLLEETMALFDALSLLIEGGRESEAVQVQALCLQQQMGELMPDLLAAALTNSHPAIRRAAIKLAEPQLGAANNATGPGPACAASIANLLEDPNQTVRFQIALSLGEWNDPASAQSLARLARTDDRWLRAAVLSSSTGKAASLLKAISKREGAALGRLSQSLVNDLIRTAIVCQEDEALVSALNSLLSAPEERRRGIVALNCYVALMDALEQRGLQWRPFLNSRSAIWLIADINQHLAAAEHIESVFDEVKRQLEQNDDEAPTDFNLFGLLGRDPDTLERHTRILAQWLRADAPAGIRKAAIVRLGKLNSPRVAEQALSVWSQVSPSTRSQLVQLFLTREDWSVSLLGTLDKGAVARAEISLPSREALLKHKSNVIRSQAKKLFADTHSANRNEVLAKYRDVSSLPPRPANGAVIFDKNCAQCHAFRGRGHAVGANLGEFVGKSVEDFILAIFDPNAAINPNVIAYNVETKDGRSLNGIVRGETASGLTLVQGSGMEEKILRSDIKEIRASQLSLMPEGLEQSMTPQDTADLIAWLKSSGPRPFGSASEEQAAKARAEFLQVGVNGLATLLTSGAELPYASWLGRLPMAYCRQDGGMNRLSWKTAPVPKDLPSDAAYTFRLPAGMGFASQPSGKFTLRLNGQPAFDFNVALSDQAWQSSDGRVRMTYTVMENNVEDSNGVLAIETHASLLQPGESAQFEIIGSSAHSQRWFGIYSLPSQTHAAIEGR